LKRSPEPEKNPPKKDRGRAPKTTRLPRVNAGWFEDLPVLSHPAFIKAS
jgi:hypothetical protein